MTNEPAELLDAAAAKLRAGDPCMSLPVAVLVANLLAKEREGIESGNWRPCVDPALEVARIIVGPGWAMQQAAADLASIEQEPEVAVCSCGYHYDEDGA